MRTTGPASDTSPEAAAARIAVLRRPGPAGRLRAGLRLSASMIALSRAALRARHPGADEATLEVLRIAEQYGEPLAQGVARRLGVEDWKSATTSQRR